MGNEVLDAMPFRRVRMKNGKWVELGVGFKRSEGKRFLIEAERNVQCELLSEYVSIIIDKFFGLVNCLQGVLL